MQKKRGEALIQQLGEALLAEPSVESAPWDGLALTAHVDDDLVMLSLYRFTGGEVVSETIQNVELPGLVRKLRKATSDKKSPPWTACLVQVSAATGDIDLHFEHDDPDRWRVTPDNFETLPATLWPNPPGP